MNTPTIDIRWDRSTVTIVPSGASEPKVPFAAPVEVDGGWVTTDVRNPLSPPHATITDCTAASSWFNLVFGGAAAKAITDPIGDSRERGLMQVESSGGPLTSCLARFAMLTWLAAWSPNPADRSIPPLDLNLLDAERGAIASYLDMCLRDDVASELLTSGAAAIPPAWDRIEASNLSGQRLARAEEIWQALLDAALDIVPRDNEAADNLRNAQRDQAERHAAEKRLMTHADEILRAKTPAPTLADSSSGFRPVRGAGPRLAGGQLHGRSTADWLMVPPRVLFTDEDNVNWNVEIRQGEPAVLGLSIKAFADGDMVAPGLQGRRLYARAYTPEQSWPVAMVELELNPRSRTFEGHARIAENSSTNNLVVDTFCSDLMQPPRVSLSARRRARIERATITSLVRGRQSDDQVSLPWLSPNSPSLAELCEW